MRSFRYVLAVTKGQDLDIGDYTIPRIRLNDFVDVAVFFFSLLAHGA